MDRRNAKKRAQRKIAKLQSKYVPFDQIGNVVKEILAATAEFGVAPPPFTLTLTSANVAGAENEYNFAAEGHFEKWLARALDRDFDADSENIRRYQDAVESNRNAFNNVRVAVQPIVGGCNKKKAETIVRETDFYTLTLYSPSSHDNNCGLKCLEYILKTDIDYEKTREKFGLRVTQKISPEDLTRIYRSLGAKKPLEYIDDDWNHDMIKGYNYLFIRNQHYYVVKDSEHKSFKDVKTKRGLLVWDIETRETEECVMVGKTPSYILKDAITCVAYKRYKSELIEHLTFVTTPEKTSVQQFKDWLSGQSNQGHFYNCVAHNGSRFDHYFFLASLTQQEQLMTRAQLRGRSIIGFQYKSHLFKDTCCFLTMSLKSACKSFKVKNEKMTSFQLNGETLTNENICFYNPNKSVKAKFWEFMALEYTEPDFWKMYTEYCLMDCISLMEVWGKFNIAYDSLVLQVFHDDKELLKNVSLMSCNTIGSLARKILEQSVYLPKGKLSYRYHTREYMKLMLFNMKTVEKDGKMKEVIDDDKIDFIAKCKRGGISACEKPGKHNQAVASVDIASQYPAAMMYMLIPAGKSEWGHDYSEFRYGFYHLKNLTFASKGFYPVASVKENHTLEWNNQVIEDIYTDSFTIDYLKRHCGLLSFEVAVNDEGQFESLTSLGYVRGEQIFGRFVKPLYDEKERQDALKAANDDNYNPALRETIKLFLNSLSGKLVEDPSHYFKLRYSENESSKINGLSIVKDKDDNEKNIWTSCGVMVYAYSKMLLFEYIHCLPNKQEDVIIIETDSIYFAAKHLDAFRQNVAQYKNEHPIRWVRFPIKFGGQLGNVKIEKNTTGSDKPSWFLGKKFYMIGDSMKVKGIPSKTIDMNGNQIDLVDETFYEQVFNGEVVKTKFATLVKQLFGERTYIAANEMVRTTKANMDYKVYD
jgi:hypothetical protein